MLQEPLRRSLAELQKQLLDLSRDASDVTIQRDCAASRQRVMQDGTTFAQQFLEQLGAAFNQLGEKEPAPDAAAVGVRSRQAFELVTVGEQEVSISLEQIRSRGEVRHSNVLYELGYRFGVLVGAPPLEGQALPIGPYVMAKACNAASSELKLPPAHQSLLLMHFGRWVIEELGPLYDNVNAQLMADGIMPQLSGIQIPRHLRTRQRPARTSDDGASGTAPVASEAAAGSASGAPIEELESLRNLLAQKHATQRRLDSSSNERTANTDELQSALGALQQHSVEVTNQGCHELHSAARLRQGLLAQLNLGKPAGTPHFQLSSEQSDTVELVVWLFEQLGHQLRQGGKASSLLADLELPMLRVAMVDHGFFNDRTHPARQLLNTVTTAANDWLDAGNDESSRPLAAKLERLVRRASQGSPSADLYSTLLADIKHHMALLARESQAAERRHIEAAKAREQLEQARHRAGELMTERFAQSQPHGLLRALLDRAWSDVLALTLLRHGEDSGTFRAQLNITDQLLGRAAIDNYLDFRSGVESGLQQIGMRAEVAVQVTERLLGKAAPDRAAGILSATELAMHLKHHRRHGEPQPGDKPSASAPTADAATPAARQDSLAQEDHTAQSSTSATAEMTTEREAIAIDPHLLLIEQHLKKLPFGTWFEFTNLATGQTARYKLVWYSPISGRCVLVDRRGQPDERTTLLQLAHEIAGASAREVPAQPNNLLDRAQRNLARSLQAHRPSPSEATRP